MTGHGDNTEPRHPHNIDPELATLLNNQTTSAVGNSEQLLALMTRLAALAVVYITGADHCALTAGFDDEHQHTVAVVPTDPQIAIFDASQHLLTDGPTRRAARTARAVSVDLADMGTLWPDLAISAHRAGITAILAAPVHAGGHAIGALTLYTNAGTHTGAGISLTSPNLIALVGCLDRCASSYGRHLTDRDNSHSSLERIEDRALIESATGMVTELEDCTIDHAHDLVDAAARIEDLTRRQVAERILDTRTL